MVYLLRDLLLWAGRLGYDGETRLEVSENRLNRKMGPLSGLVTGAEWAFFGVIRLVLGWQFIILLK